MASVEAPMTPVTSNIVRMNFFCRLRRGLMSHTTFGADVAPNKDGQLGAVLSSLSAIRECDRLALMRGFAAKNATEPGPDPPRWWSRAGAPPGYRRVLSTHFQRCRTIDWRLARRARCGRERRQRFRTIAKAKPAMRRRRSP